MKKEFTQLFQYYIQKGDSEAIGELLRRICVLKAKEEEEGFNEFKIFSSDQFIQALFTQLIANIAPMELFNKKTEVLLTTVMHDDFKLYQPILADILIQTFSDRLEEKSGHSKRSLKSYIALLRREKIIDNPFILNQFNRYAEKLIKQNRYTHLQELQELAASLGITLHYDEKAVLKASEDIDATVKSLRGFSGSLGLKFNQPTASESQQFEQLSGYSQSGNAAASLALARLYASKSAIAGQPIQWVSDPDKASLYGLLAIFQAQSLGDKNREAQARKWYKDKFKREGSLQAFYEEILAKALAKKDLTAADPLVQTLVFIATSVHFSKFSDPMLPVKGREANFSALQQCINGKDKTGMIDRFIVIYQALVEHDCQIFTIGEGEHSVSDPGERLAELTVRKKFNSMNEAVQCLANKSMSCDEALAAIATKLKQPEELTFSHLQQIHSYLTHSETYLGKVPQNKEEREAMLTEMLETFCKKSKAPLSIIRRQARADLISAHAEVNDLPKSPDINFILKEISNNRNEVNYEDFWLYCADTLNMSNSEMGRFIHGAYMDILPSCSNGQPDSNGFFASERMPLEAKFRLVAEQSNYRVISSQGNDLAPGKSNIGG